jgi:phosphoribosylformimino-5-aminoimidazole carboxamide ribotide isomerase
MEIIPAIDLKDGRCVRLFQGDYSQETVFSEEPLAMALHWQSLGASRLHLVDLDGAAKGKPAHLPLIQKIVAGVNIPVQLGGGIRSKETIEKLLNIGVANVILGTVLIENPLLVKKACRQFGEAIIVSIDAREGYVVTHGWQEQSDFTAAELAQRLAELGAKQFIYTDVNRDGTLTQPNFEAIAELIEKTRLPIIAAGGISSINHLLRLKRIGAVGAIVGRAIYAGEIDLSQAMKSILEEAGSDG